MGVWCCCCRLVAYIRGSANGIKTGVRPGLALGRLEAQLDTASAVHGSSCVCTCHV